MLLLFNGQRPGMVSILQLEGCDSEQPCPKLQEAPIELHCYKWLNYNRISFTEYLLCTKCFQKALKQRLRHKNFYLYYTVHIWTYLLKPCQRTIIQGVSIHHQHQLMILIHSTINGCPSTNQGEFFPVSFISLWSTKQMGNVPIWCSCNHVSYSYQNLWGNRSLIMILNIY